MDLYEKIVSNYTNFITKYDLMRKAAVPITSDFEDDGNPRISKIGGKFPYLPNEEISLCNECHQFPMMVAQLYVPSLPDFIQVLFPSDFKNSLIVLSVCPSCLGSKCYNVKAYNESQLDDLEYHDDVGEKWSTPEFLNLRCFNFQPNSPQTYDLIDQKRQYFEFKTITNWNETMMAPYTSVGEVKSLLKKEKIEDNHRTFLAAHEINMKNEIAGNSYLGGWPCFCQEDQTPEGYKILLNLSESAAATLEWGNSGTAQLWIGVGGNSGKFKFTCSSH
ncbi:hypothetical protein TRFO_30030 [Tritrichomonas foetus]|uniref:Programmed cell death protein 2 C-terminal domain-containing protein n=1 Tax=Tritrichomonas foetus TaxID=1144522 RepID=A0A1J4JUU2_9EUKA|nr:hypothetical protein TRFO_30030 [Tritrichomonas foetus]|eukprot:OHT02771.1 hypothetical protein TRFO_30030 [Tritrichomonas foetus]